MTLDPQEIIRYQRHIILSQVGSLGQQKLKDAKVLVIGAGGLGCPVLQYLCAAGIGQIGIVDGDCVDNSNLQRQILYSEKHVGRPKVECVQEILSAQNSFVQFRTYNEFISVDNALEMIAPWDLVIDGSDNFSTRYLVNDACILLNKPLVYGALHQFSGQLSVFNYQGGPSYRCLFPEIPDANSIPNCAEAGVLGVLPGIIGTLQATEALKMILGIGSVASGVLLLWDALSLEVSKIKFVKDPAQFMLTELKSTEISCQSSIQDLSAEISVNELEDKLLKHESIQLLDVREEWEWDLVHFPNALLVQNLDDLLELNKNQAVVVYCHHGIRSLDWVAKLKGMGFMQVYSLLGGIDQWALEIDGDMLRY